MLPLHNNRHAHTMRERIFTVKSIRAKKTAALILAFCIAITSPALASTLGREVDGYITGAPGGIELARGVFWTGSDYRTENYIECIPSAEVFPVVVYGSKITNYGNFSSMAALMESKGYHVIAGINGDYFNTRDYQPLGLVVAEGILGSSDGGHWAVGFKPDGGTVIGKPNLNMRVNIGEDSYPLASVNKAMSGIDFSLFTSDYAPTTKSAYDGRFAVLSAVPGENLTMDCELSLRVDEIIESKSAVPLPDGKLILALPKSADAWRQQGMDSLGEGSELTVKITCDENWRDVSYAVGSLYKLVTNGRVENNLEAGAAPRSAVGLKADGTIVLYTIDGRKSGHSVGASMSQVAERLIELGCVEACIMDGGGSTSLNSIYVGDSSISQINNPSDGKQRSVTNYIMLVTTAERTGRAAELALYPFSAHALPGAKIQFGVKAADAAGYAASVPKGVSYSVDEDLGVVDSDGLYTAAGSGRGTVTASHPDMTPASVNVNIVETPDIITVKNETTGRIVTKIEIEPGGTVDLAANAAANYVELISDDSCYIWTVTEGTGEIDETGKFTAGEKYSEGQIMVSAGEKTVTLDVKVGRQPGIYTDVLETDPYYEAVRFAGEAGLMNGMSETEFMPLGEMTRAMFATVLWRLEGEPVTEAENVFTDVLDGKWYTNAVIWASAHGVVEGYGDGIFGVSDSITREQMVTMLYRYAQSRGMDVNVAEGGAAEQYEDFGTAREYALPALKWACAHSVLSGESEGALAPGGMALRHVVATAFMNFILIEDTGEAEGSAENPDSVDAD